MKKLNKKGFTIVELVIVIAVIAILAAVLIPTYTSVVDKANASKALQEARNAYTEYIAAHPTAKIDYIENAAGTIYDVNDGFKTVSAAESGDVVLTIGTCLEEKGEGTDTTCPDCGWTLTEKTKTTE